MSEYTKYISSLRASVEMKSKIEEELREDEANLGELESKVVNMLEAISLISVLSDRNTNAVLDYITGVINKTLAEIFPYDVRRVELQRKMHGEKHAHIVLKLTNSKGKSRNLVTQSGTGIRQVIAFLYNLCLIEIRKGRRLFLSDELLSGLHEDAKKIIVEIIKIFSEEGFQFIMVEYGVNDLGKVYLVEKPSDIATVAPLDGEYTGQIFEFNKPIGYEEADKIEAFNVGSEDVTI